MPMPSQKRSNGRTLKQSLQNHQHFQQNLRSVQSRSDSAQLQRKIRRYQRNSKQRGDRKKGSRELERITSSIFPSHLRSLSQLQSQKFIMLFFPSGAYGLLQFSGISGTLYSWLFLWWLRTSIWAGLLFIICEKRSKIGDGKEKVREEEML